MNLPEAYSLPESDNMHHISCLGRNASALHMKQVLCSQGQAQLTGRSSVQKLPRLHLTNAAAGLNAPFSTLSLNLTCCRAGATHG